VLLSSYSFEDDVFVDGEKDNGTNESRSKRRKRRHKHAKAKRACDDYLTLPRGSLKSFRRRIHTFRI